MPEEIDNTISYAWRFVDGHPLRVLVDTSQENVAKVVRPLLRRTHSGELDNLLMIERVEAVDMIHALLERAEKAEAKLEEIKRGMR
jgi:hypothetical protein